MDKPIPNPFASRAAFPGAARHGHFVDHETPPPAPERAPERRSTHGGSRNAGRRMKSNTSGLAGISFRVRTSCGKRPRKVVYIVAIWTDAANVGRSNAYNIDREGGPVLAMRKALAVRRLAGLPPVSAMAAMKALKRFLEGIDHPIPEDLERLRFDEAGEDLH